MEKISTPKSPAAIGPYSQAIKTGNLIFTSGQIPFTAEGKLVSADVKEQTIQSLQNLKNILEKAGTGMDNIIKCTVFISDMDQFAQVNEVYQQFFNEPYPARSCVEVARLPKDVKVEIEAIALAD
ncbi:MAG: RidA family protein [Halanaerobiales bacterium]|nr:RidA family protein [Halanaerobiales bacterium]